MGSIDLLGWFAATLVFSTFWARQMLSLRAIAIASNLAFIGYGYLDHLWPIAILHLAMLPLNAVRFRQALRAAPSEPREPKRTRQARRIRVQRRRPARAVRYARAIPVFAASSSRPWR